MNRKVFKADRNPPWGIEKSATKYFRLILIGLVFFFDYLDNIQYKKIALSSVKVFKTFSSARNQVVQNKYSKLLVWSFY